jgi:phage-related protein
MVAGRRAGAPLTLVVTYDYTVLDVCKDKQSMRQTRPISWVKAARKDFERFPEEAKSVCWMALTVAAEGGKADIVKPLLGLGSAVFEIALPYRGKAFRVVYAVQLGDDIWVVHAFQKKSTQGIKTPKHEIDLVEQRLKRLKEVLG